MSSGFFPCRILELGWSWSSLGFVLGQVPAHLPEAALTNMSDVSPNFL